MIRDKESTQHYLGLGALGPEEPQLPGLGVVPLQELALLAVTNRPDLPVVSAVAARHGPLDEDRPEGEGARLDPDVLW